MKIVYVIHSFLPEAKGGTELHSYHLAKCLSDRHTIHVFCRGHDPNADALTITRGHYDGLETFKIQMGRQNKSTDYAYSSPAIDQIFAEYLADSKPDLIHVHNLRRLSVNIPRIARRSGTPVVGTVHDYWYRCPMGALVNSDDRICTRMPGPLCLSCLRPDRTSHRRRRYLPWRLANPLLARLYLAYRRIHATTLPPLERYTLLDWLYAWRDTFVAALGTMDMIVVPSKHLRQSLIEYGVLPDKVRFIRHAVPREVQSPKCKTRSTYLRLALIGNYWLKGPQVLFDALTMVPTDRLELVLFGPMQDHITAKALEALRRTGMSISIRSSYDASQIPEVYQDIDALIVPSIWPETGPLVVLEAMANKTAVIASNIGGMAELVKDGVNGFTFQAGDAADLAQRIQQIIDHPEILAALGRNAPPVQTMADYAREIEDIYIAVVEGMV